jgi:solute carrier family 25 carnitine/acylcarnitine transporter 20/29
MDKGRGQGIVLRGRDNECARRGGIWFLVSFAILHGGALADKSSFWSYEWCKQAWSSPNDTDRETAFKVLMCGGLAGVITWASIFPLDVIKTRVQTQVLQPKPVRGGEQQTLLHAGGRRTHMGAVQIAKHAYQTEGAGVFFRGLGICSVRAFIVNAVQWAVYEWMMRILQQQ